MIQHVSSQFRQLLVWGGLISIQGCTIWANPLGTKLDLDLSSVASGLYLLHFDQVATPYKLIKQ